MPTAEVREAETRTTDYAIVTERPGLRATRDQRAILEARYAWAASQARGGRTLEAACGAGLGLGMLAAASAAVVGFDLDPHNCALAREAYAGEPHIEIETGDAASLPFAAGSFDTVVLFEALYYLADVPQFLSEARRVLRPGGRILLASVNPQWTGFAPSPLATRYWTAGELAALGASRWLRVEVWTGFPEDRTGRRARAVAAVRRAAARLGLFPGSLRAKAWLKRCFYGRMTRLPRRLENVREAAALRPAAPDTDWTSVRMFYVRLTEREETQHS